MLKISYSKLKTWKGRKHFQLQVLCINDLCWWLVSLFTLFFLTPCTIHFINSLASLRLPSCFFKRRKWKCAKAAQHTHTWDKNRKYLRGKIHTRPVRQNSRRWKYVNMRNFAMLTYTLDPSWAASGTGM